MEKVNEMGINSDWRFTAMYDVGYRMRYALELFDKGRRGEAVDMVVNGFGEMKGIGCLFGMRHADWVIRMFLWKMSGLPYDGEMEKIGLAN